MSRRQPPHIARFAFLSASALASTLAGCSGLPDGGPGLRVVSPNGGEVWEAGLEATVLWTNSARTTTITVQLSNDGGATWFDLASAVPNSGALDVTAPPPASAACLVRVIDPESGEADASDEPFAIVGGGVRVLSPNGSERLTVGDESTIRWVSSGVETVLVELSRDGGSNWEEIAAAAPAAAGGLSWTVDGGGLGLPQDACVIRVSDSAGVETPDESDDFFMIWSGTWTFPGRIVARPGEVYVIRFEAPVDDAADGTVWAGPEVAETFLAPMFRPAVALKADDLRTPLHQGFIRLFDEMSARGLPLAAGVICESLLDATPEDVSRLSGLDPALVEVFHHGYDHSFGDGWCEFFGTGLDFQLERLLSGADLARATLGIELRAFGAPYNATDADTVAALELAPSFEAIFFQPHVDGRTTYSRNLDVEIDAGIVFGLDEFMGLYSAFEQEDILALQCHPTSCDEENKAKLMSIVDFLAGAAGRRFTAPTAYARWLVDRDAIVLKKVRGTRYELDFRSATYPQVLDFSVAPNSVTEK